MNAVHLSGEIIERQEGEHLRIRLAVKRAGEPGFDLVEVLVLDELAGSAGGLAIGSQIEVTGHMESGLTSAHDPAQVVADRIAPVSVIRRAT
jgi:hypothetical protein